MKARTARRPRDGSAPTEVDSVDGEPPQRAARTSAVVLDPSVQQGPVRLLSHHRLRSGSAQTRAFRRAFFSRASDREWNDWRWQIRHRLRHLDQLSRVLRLSESELGALSGQTKLPAAVTPYFASLLDPIDPRQPLRRTMIPTLEEWQRSEGEADDPLGEESHTVLPGLVHRYPDRVLLLAHDRCAAFCRYCTRSRLVGRGGLRPDPHRLRRAVDSIASMPTIRDVLISGGDPLLLSDEHLDWLLGQLRAIKHVEILRLGTKVPVVLPQRIQQSLLRVLRRHHPLWMSIHFTHPAECTPETVTACGRLADAGIPLGSQTVLLKGINDDVETMRELFHQLQRMRVRPYYLYQCDPISGSGHFRTPVARGLEIIEGLRGHTSGYVVPTYVVDAPGGGGKIPLMPSYVLDHTGQELLLRNYAFDRFSYPDPTTETSRWDCSRDFDGGVSC